jgi:hypothetical protein
MTKPAPGDKVYYYPNKIGRIVLLATEEVMGRNGVNAALNLGKLRHLVNNYPPNNFDRQFSFEEVGRIQQALEEMYARAAHAIGSASRPGLLQVRHSRVRAGAGHQRPGVPPAAARHEDEGRH